MRFYLGSYFTVNKHPYECILSLKSPFFGKLNIHVTVCENLSFNISCLFLIHHVPNKFYDVFIIVLNIIIVISSNVHSF